MSTEIFVISGFLGAGKTTLIQKLLGETFQNEKIVLIENDFGDISVDAALLKSSSIEVKEMNSGCICCSRHGDLGICGPSQAVSPTAYRAVLPLLCTGDFWVTVEGTFFLKEYESDGQKYNDPRIQVTKITPAEVVEGYVYPY